MIALLQTKGWQFRDGTIWSPSSGLWFSDSHFGHESPSKIFETFTERAARIARSEHINWQTNARENQEAAWAAGEVMKDDHVA